ncbi:MAG TPA: PIG-L deacetylase family protein [Terriglobia bacterium]|nr:PIG-L deacetylase family protein [Terriglobia bacterium]
MSKSINVLALFAHPDDAEFLCAGTLAHLAGCGATVHMATLTAGDCGSTSLPPAKISAVRQQEASKAAGLIGARYHCLKSKDLLIFYDQPHLNKVMELVRLTRPSLVLTHSPVDYMIDHETVSKLCQSSCFGAMAPNFKTGARRPAPPLAGVPHLYYADAFGRRDILGSKIESRLSVNISATLKRKEEMLACHDSQQAWLKTQQEIPETVQTMRKMAQEAGKRARFRWAEGFRQHLGQGFPASNLLKELLGPLVR